MGQQQRFELQADSPESNFDAQANQAYLAFHQDFRESGNRVILAQNRQGDAAPQGQGGQPEQLEPTTRAGKMLADVMNQYVAAPDKKAAMKDLGPKFEAAKQAADTDMAAAQQNFVTEIQKLAPDMQKAKAEIGAAGMNLNAEIEKLPADKKGRLQALAQELAEGATPEREAAIEEIVKKEFPGVHKASEDMQKVFESHAPTFEKAEKLYAGLAESVADTFNTRMAFAKALRETGGDASKAEQMEMEALQIIAPFLQGPGQPQPRGPERLPPAQPQNNIRIYKADVPGTIGTV